MKEFERNVILIINPFSLKCPLHYQQFHLEVKNFPTGQVYLDHQSIALFSIKSHQQNGGVQSHSASWKISATCLLDQHSLIGQQLQLNPPSLRSTQVRKLLQHVNI